MRSYLLTMQQPGGCLQFLSSRNTPCTSQAIKCFVTTMMTNETILAPCNTILQWLRGAHGARTAAGLKKPMMSVSDDSSPRRLLFFDPPPPELAGSERGAETGLLADARSRPQDDEEEEEDSAFSMALTRESPTQAPPTKPMPANAAATAPPPLLLTAEASAGFTGRAGLGAPRATAAERAERGELITCNNSYHIYELLILPSFPFLPFICFALAPPP
jgi:hypothetical protein